MRFFKSEILANDAATLAAGEAYNQFRLAHLGDYTEESWRFAAAFWHDARIFDVISMDADVAIRIDFIGAWEPGDGGYFVWRLCDCRGIDWPSRQPIDVMQVEVLPDGTNLRLGILSTDGAEIELVCSNLINLPEPYGWAYRQYWELITVDSEQAVLDRVRQMIHDGLDDRVIAAQLNAMNYRDRAGMPWNMRSVGAVFRKRIVAP